MDDNIINLGQQRDVLERVELMPLSEFGQHAPAVIQELIRVAQEDNHGVLNPTHLLMKGGRIIGYMSLGGLPMVHCWFDTKNKHVGDSLKMIEHGQTALRAVGVRDYTVCCAEGSPFSPHLERLGYVRLGPTVVWRKTF